MSLPAGSKVGPYEIIGSIGAGGMGEVYRARDAKLGRDVAIKILPGSVSHDPDRLARFEREARTLASLNHPNIAQVYGFEDGALVMELLEGQTLRDRLSEGALPVRKAIEYASQMARGLAAAHDRGIIHRDLKPENVFLLRDGQVKLLDFGLARPIAAPASDATATLAVVGTDPGTVLGTVGYMSPEQVRAEVVDARTDLFSLGAVLYEMLSGERAFRRDTTAETMTAILREEPAELSSARAEISPAIDRIVRHALEKNPLERFQTARDVAFALDSLSGSTSAAVAAPPVRPRFSRERMAWAAVTVVLAGLAIWLGLRPSTGAAQPQPYHLAVSLPDEIRSSEFMPPLSRLAVSEDGIWLAYAGSDASGTERIWVVSLRNGTVRQIEGTANGYGPVWSPDGSQVAYTLRIPGGNASRRIAVAGGAPEILAPFGGARAWSPTGALLFSGRVAAGAGIRWIDTRSGTVNNYDNQGGFLRPMMFLPDGRRFLMSELAGNLSPVGIHVGSLDSTERTKLIDGASAAIYARGAIAYVRGTTLIAQRFDEERLELIGPTVVLAEGIDQTVAGGHALAGSPSGTVVLQRPDPPGRSRLHWYRRDGTQTATAGDAADYSNVELSPDGRRVLVTISDTTLRTRDVHIVDLDRGVRQRLTFDPSDERSAVWSADGRRVFYRSKNGDLYARRADFTGDADEFVVDGRSKDPYAVSQDGKYLAYRVTAKDGSNDIMFVPVDKSGPATAVRATGFDESGGTFSPDSRSIAYQSDESGQMEIYVTATDGSGGKVQLSNGGGRLVRWSRDGTEVFYMASNRMLMSVPVKGSGATFQAGVTRPLFMIDVPQNAGVPYDVSNDGQRIIAIAAIEGTAKPALTAIINWPALIPK